MKLLKQHATSNSLAKVYFDGRQRVIEESKTAKLLHSSRMSMVCSRPLLVSTPEVSVSCFLVRLHVKLVLQCTVLITKYNVP